MYEVYNIHIKQFKFPYNSGNIKYLQFYVSKCHTHYVLLLHIEIS